MICVRYAILILCFCHYWNVLNGQHCNNRDANFIHWRRHCRVPKYDNEIPWVRPKYSHDFSRHCWDFSMPIIMFEMYSQRLSFHSVPTTFFLVSRSLQSWIGPWLAYIQYCHWTKSSLTVFIVRSWQGWSRQRAKWCVHCSSSNEPCRCSTGQSFGPKWSPQELKR